MSFLDDITDGVKNGILIAEKKRLMKEIKEKQNRLKEIEKELK